MRGQQELYGMAGSVRPSSLPWQQQRHGPYLVPGGQRRAERCTGGSAALGLLPVALRCHAV